MEIFLKIDNEDLLKDTDAHKRIIKEVHAIFERNIDALVHHYKVSKKKECVTKFHAELDDGFARITIPGKDLKMVMVEILTQDDWLDSIESEKTMADIGKWVTNK